MKLVEKRDYIHSRLHQLSEQTIDELFEHIRKQLIMADKLSVRANKAEEDIRKGKTMSKSEIKNKLDYPD